MLVDTPSILITDDDHAFRETVKGMLEPRGFRALTAADGEEALKIVGAEPVHLLLLDMHMPRLTGLETLSVHRSGITNAGLRHLRHLPKLVTLLLQGTQVNDEATEELSKLKQLRAINLLQTQFSRKGIEELKQRLPKTQILF